MRSRGGRDLGEKAAAWMATCVVFMLGAVVCAFIATAFAGDARSPLLAGAAVFAAAAMTIWLLRDKPKNEILEREGFLSWFRRPPAATHYKFSRKRPAGPEAEAPRPPTAADIRELKNDAHTWAPSGKPKKSQRDSDSEPAKKEF